MSREFFEIEGGRSLHGEISLSGSKNAAAPILAATLLTDKPYLIKNVPKIEDIYRMVELLKGLGAQCIWQDHNSLYIRCLEIDPTRINKEIVKKIRISILLLGPLLARFGKVETTYPGGCLIGARPIDSHLEAFEDLGAKVKNRGDNIEIKLGKNYGGGEIVLKEFSVTATENVLMTLAKTAKKTRIKIAALEPHVIDLCNFLKKMGVRISIGAGHVIEVIGNRNLKSCHYTLIPDFLEAGSFLILAAVCKGKVLIKDIVVDHLDIVLRKLKEFNVRITLKRAIVRNGLKIADILIETSPFLKACKIQTLPYPGLASDLQSPFGVLATQAHGSTLIHETLYEGRLKYIKELNRMGANAILLDSHRALITGPTPLVGKEISSFDIRSGMSLIIAALIAKGKTVIKDIYQVDRGYERIEERLQKLGAHIKRVNNP